MSGMDRQTGKRLSGWPHVEQSLGVLLTTPRRSRVMRRQVGTGVTRRVDMPISPVNLIDLYADVAAAIIDQEPRFRPVRMSAEAAVGGITIDVAGIYYPRGHLGDFTISEPKNAEISL